MEFIDLYMIKIVWIIIIVLKIHYIMLVKFMIMILTSSIPSGYTAHGVNKNNDQLPMWNGYFYSRDGWQTATSINTNNCADYGMSNTDPVFSGGDSDYKYVIFEYKYVPVSSTPFGGFVIFGDDTNADIELSDINSTNPNVRIHLYIQDYNMNGYYYLNIGKDTDTTFGEAASGSIEGYVNSTGLGKSRGTDSEWKNGGTLIATSGNGGWAAGRPTSSNLKRTLNFIFNKLTYNSGNTGPNIEKSHYLAIGIKNNVNRRFKKPKLYIYTGDNGVIELT